MKISPKFCPKREPQWNGGSTWDQGLADLGPNRGSASDPSG